MFVWVHSEGCSASAFVLETSLPDWSSRVDDPSLNYPLDSRTTTVSSIHPFRNPLYQRWLFGGIARELGSCLERYWFSRIGADVHWGEVRDSVEPISKAVRRVSSRLMRVRWLLPLTAKHFLMGTDLIVVPTCNGRPLNARIVNQILCCVNNDTFKFTIQGSLLLVYGVNPPTHGLQW